MAKKAPVSVPKAAESAPESADEKILARARKRFAASVEYWRDVYDLAKDDIKFANGNSDNGWQWDQRLLMDRRNAAGGARPSLTINKIPQHVSQVTNDQRRNKPQIKVRAVNEEGDDEVAEVQNGMIRHIWRNANDCYEGGDVAASIATEQQVEGGIGYLKVASDYYRNDSDEQDLYIGSVTDFSMIYDDPSIKTVTGRDRKYLFETAMLDEVDFEATYPDADPVDWDAVGASEYAQWFSNERKQVRVAKYWEATTEKSKKGRPRTRVVCYTLTGNAIVERNGWAGKYIPFARVVGHSRIIDGKPEIMGIVRNAKDAQRLYNYGRSAQAEHIALSPKAPFIADAKSISGYEDQWQAANNAPFSVLYFNAYDPETGQQLPMPQRAAGTMPNAAISEMVALASDDIKATTGQYDASLGNRSNETSGVAIRQRQAEGDMATFHFVDNLAYSIKFIGDILVDAIPLIYDTPRIARILGEDDVADYAELDPSAEHPVVEYADRATGKKRKKYNLSMGQYDVAVTVGPGYSTQRQEALEFLQMAGQSAPQILAATVDLLPKLADMPMADEMSKRLRTVLPPETRQVTEAGQNGEELPPEAIAMMNQAKQQMGQVMGQLDAAMQQLQALQAENQNLQQGHDLKAAEIQSRERIAAMNNEAKLQVEQVRGEMKAQLEMMQARLDMAQQAHAQAMQPATQVVLGATGEAKSVTAVEQAVAETQQAMMQIAQMVQGVHATQQQLAQMMTESQAPRQKTVSMRGPSGQMYHAVIDGGNITMQSPSGGTYQATVQ